jgi:hypothetical protein
MCRSCACVHVGLCSGVLRLVCMHLCLCVSVCVSMDVCVLSLVVATGNFSKNEAVIFSPNNTNAA